MNDNPEEEEQQQEELLDVDDSVSKLPTVRRVAKKIHYDKIKLNKFPRELPVLHVTHAAHAHATHATHATCYTMFLDHCKQTHGK